MSSFNNNSGHLNHQRLPPMGQQQQQNFNNNHRINEHHQLTSSNPNNLNNNGNSGGNNDNRPGYYSPPNRRSPQQHDGLVDVQQNKENRLHNNNNNGNGDQSQYSVNVHNNENAIATAASSNRDSPFTGAQSNNNNNINRNSNNENDNNINENDYNNNNNNNNNTSATIPINQQTLRHHGATTQSQDGFSDNQSAATTNPRQPHRGTGRGGAGRTGHQDNRGWVYGALFCETSHNYDPNDLSWTFNPARTHAWHFPLHSRQIAAWLTKLILVVLYATTIAWPADKYEIHGLSTKQYSVGVNMLVSLVLTMNLALAAAITIANPGDSTPIHPSQTTYCNFCRHDVDKSCKHCKSCNRCVRQFDHHCKWLNTCIGEANYVFFYWYLVSLLVAIGLVMSLGIATLAIVGDQMPGAQFAFAIITVILCGVILFPIANLFIYHSYLSCKGITTFEDLTGAPPPPTNSDENEMK